MYDPVASLSAPEAADIPVNTNTVSELKDGVNQAPAMGAPMKVDMPWNMVTRPNALVSRSRPISSTMSIDRRDTNTAAKQSNEH